jgi:cyanophycinase
VVAAGNVPIDPRGVQCLAAVLGIAPVHPRVLLLQARTDDEEAGGDDGLDGLFHEAGAGELTRHLLRGRADAGEQRLLDALERAQVVALVTDQPLRLSTLLGGTLLARAIRRRNAEGAIVLGCGAGAAILCEHMLALGASDGPTPRSGGAQLAPGLGLTNRVVIDQGGHASDRIGRLLAGLALNPFALGLGIDDATAAVIGADNVLEVVGSGGVTLIDPAEMADSNVLDLAPGAPIRITNLRLHALVAGTRYDLDFRRTVAWEP